MGSFTAFLPAAEPVSHSLSQESLRAQHNHRCGFKPSSPAQ